MPLVEKRYAEALISISEQAKTTDEFQKDLGSVVEIWKTQQDFRTFLTNPEVKADTKKTVIHNVFDGQVKKELVNFLSLLLDKGRIQNLPGIFDEYVKHADRLKNTLNVTILSAAPLDEKQVDSIVSKYQKLYNATGVKVNREIQPNLIGGVKVKIGDKIVDGTIQGRLEGLRAVLIGD